MKVIMKILLFILLQATDVAGSIYLSDGDFTTGISFARAQMNKIHEHLLLIKGHLIQFENQNGRYPTNDEGLSVLDGLRTKIKELDIEYDNSYYEMRNGEIRRFDSEILSPWYVPFIYENRRGQNENMFSESPVNNDHGENYSVRVDEGIFVYSSGAIDSFKTYTLFKMRLYKGYCFFAFTYVLVFFLFISVLTKKFQGILIALSVSVYGYFINVGSMVRSTCYATDVFSKYEHIDKAEVYVELLNKYHDAGVISDETYAKRLKIMEELSIRVNGR